MRWDLRSEEEPYKSWEGEMISWGIEMGVRKP